MSSGSTYLLRILDHTPWCLRSTFGHLQPFIEAGACVTFEKQAGREADVRTDTKKDKDMRMYLVGSLNERLVRLPQKKIKKMQWLPYHAIVSV